VPTNTNTSKASTSKASTSKASTSKRNATPSAAQQGTLFTVSPAYSTEQGARMGAAAGPGNAGYVVRWPNKGADVLMRTGNAKGTTTLWRVRCNAHGYTTDVPDNDKGSKRTLESAAGRAVWCAGCKASAAPAPAAAAAKPRTRKASTSKVAK
jgi:hypothetical protein